MAASEVVWEGFQVLSRLKGIIGGLREAGLLRAYFDLHLELGTGVRATSPHFCNTRTLLRFSMLIYFVEKPARNLEPLSFVSLPFLLQGVIFPPI